MDDAYGQWQEDPRFQSVLDFFDMNCFSYDCWKGESFKELMEKIVYNNMGWELEWSEGMKLSEYLDMLSDYGVLSDCGSEISVPVPRKAQWQGASLVEAYTDAVSGQTDAEIYYYHSDHLGSGSVITDEDGGVYQALAYAPFGETLVNIKHGSYDEPYKFTGYERDRETGFDYAHQRYYWSDLGIFLSVDPLAHLYPHMSSYAYCGNNPVIRIDPTGEHWVESEDKSIYWDEKATSQKTTKEREVYLGKNVLVGTHNRDENLNEPINTARFDLYLESNKEGPTATIYGNTVPADVNKYGTLAEGTYSAEYTVYKGDGAILINGGRNLPTVNGNPNNKKNYTSDGMLKSVEEHVMDNILFHKGNYARSSLSTSSGMPISAGCQTGGCGQGTLPLYRDFIKKAEGFNGSYYLRSK